MKDKDIMSAEVYQIKNDEWQVMSDGDYITLRLPAYKLSSWSEDSYLTVIMNGDLTVKEIIVDWNSSDFTLHNHKTFFRFDDDLPDNLECMANADRTGSIVLESAYVYENLLKRNLLIVRASLKKSKTTRMFDVSKFRDVVKEL